MDKGTAAVTMVPVMLAFFCLGMPFFMAMGTVGLIYGVASFGLKVLPIADMKVYGFLTEPSFIAVPMFVLMGTTLASTGIAEMLFMSIYRFFGSIRGGLLVAVGLVCTLMGACTGVAAGVIATMGIAALPTMLKNKYEPGIACGCIGACGCLGTIIPPSVILIILGIMADIPIGRLYFAAFMPGFLVSAVYIVYFLIKAWLSPYDAPSMSPDERGDARFITQLWMLGRDVLPVLFLVFGVLGTIYTGVCTPTEGAGIGAFGAVIISMIYRKFTLSTFSDSLVNCYRVTATTAGIMIGANFFSSVFLKMGGGAKITDIAIALGLGKTGVMLAVLLMNFILGFFLSNATVILILVPIFWPILRKYGVDDLWFAMLFTMMNQIGLLTPPMAPGVYLLKPLCPPGNRAYANV